ncbi:MAG: metal-dependent transcriptional regulator [Anaerolinea sp.]|nr:metal-dependent transcriptional regulator [Anaerolinea sp.]
MSIGASAREYLAEAYRLAYYQPDSPYISTSALAEAMNVSAPAVTRMVQRLKQAGYLEHERYKGILLTPEGEREALRSIRKHRLVEVFLVDVMRFGWHEVHDAADALGHSVSDRVVARMEEMARFPRRCPHGEPIPRADGSMPRVRDLPLNEAAPGRTYAVSRVSTHDRDKLQYLGQLGLKPGTRFELVARAPFNGPLQLCIRDRSGEQTHVLGHELAGTLRVCPPEQFELP